jgi:hypothetical protein
MTDLDFDELAALVNDRRYDTTRYYLDQQHGHVVLFRCGREDGDVGVQLNRDTVGAFVLRANRGIREIMADLGVERFDDVEADIFDAIENAVAGESYNATLWG